MNSRHALAALAVVFALAHVPFLATSLEDIDSVNFAMGVRDFDVAEHRPHPPGYPVYIAMGKAAVSIAGAVMNGEPSAIDARALAVVSLISGLALIPLLYLLFGSLNARGEESVWSPLDIGALSATAIAISCPLFSYLAIRPMSDLPGLAVATAAQACLLRAWQRWDGRLILLGAFLAAIALGMRSQTIWFTAPVLVLVLGDRIGRGVARALVGSAVTFTIGALLWAVPLLMATGGLAAYMAALGTTARDEFAAGEMLYLNPTDRRLVASVVWRTFVSPWDSTPLAMIVLLLAAAGLVQLAWRDRRALAGVASLALPYLAFHMIFQDTSFVRYALPGIPAIAFLATRGAALATEAAVPVAAAVVSVWAFAIAAPVLSAYAAEPSPTVRVVRAMEAEAPTAKPGALAMHQTFRRPLEAETISIAPQLPSPPRMEWLELVKYWRDGHVEPVWFLADPSRSDLALIDPQSRLDSTEIAWPLVARPSFGGMRPDRVRWYRMRAPGWFADQGWALTPETAGMARLQNKGPDLGPITAYVRRRGEAARVMIGGRNLAAAGDPSARFTLAIDDRAIESWDVAPGFFLRVIELAPGQLAGDDALARLTVQSSAASGAASIPAAVEQFDVQTPETAMWGFDQGWNEAEYSQQLGVWRWTSEKATLRLIGPPVARRITLRIESPLRYFGRPSRVRIVAGARELGAMELSETFTWTLTVPADVVEAAGGLVTIETDQTFSPFERSGAPDRRRLGLRIFSADVAVSLTPREPSR